MSVNQENVANFDVLKIRYIITGILECVTQMHIGIGRSETAFGVDSPFITVSIGDREYPYIPGSTLKGVFRSEVERILRTQDPKAVCLLDTKECSCLACQLFGSMKFGSHILFMDAHPIEEIQKKIKPGVAINRITGAAQPRALYTFETVQPGAKFNFHMVLENIDLTKNKDLKVKALKSVLNRLIQGDFSMGGKRSSGLGVVKLVDSKYLKITMDNIFDPNLEEKRLDLKTFLLGS
ncbi:MAG: RAMP superfamily CRISPR-associated protein [Promethearchaeota archaeon]